MICLKHLLRWKIFTAHRGPMAIYGDNKTTNTHNPNNRQERMTLKSRLTVLFDTPEHISGQLQRNDTHIVLEGSGQLAQNRTTQDLADEQKQPNAVRITWRSATDAGASAIKPELLDGLNVYVYGGSQSYDGSGESDGEIGTNRHRLSAKFVSTPVHQVLHMDHFDLDLVREFLPPHAVNVDFKWHNHDYDIIIDDKLRIDDYYALSNGTSFVYGAAPPFDKAEAGLFYVDTQDSSDVNLSGIRCLWNSSGAVERCQKTFLFYKPAHFAAGEPATPISLAQPAGLHPTLRVDLSERVPSESCDFFVYMNLPVDVFVDKFQTSPVFVFGEHDLELPEYRLRDRSWGSETMYKLVPGVVNEVTLHSRYAEPQPDGGYSEVGFTPFVFQACDTGNDQVAENPFYVKHLGYEAYFTTDTVFHHLNSTRLSVSIPRADTKDYGAVQLTTLACLALSVVYILRKLLKPFNRQ